MAFRFLDWKKSRYLNLVMVCLSLVLPSSCSKYRVREMVQLGSYEITFAEKGIEAQNYDNIPLQQWWALFYQHFVNIDAGKAAQNSHFEQKDQFETLVRLIEMKGKEFVHDHVGTVKYLELGNNSGPIANVSYFRILEGQSLSPVRQLDLLIEKGVEVSWKSISEKTKSISPFRGESRNQGIPWILYRFRVSRLVDDQRKALSTTISLSCDKYYCVTATDGTRSIFLTNSKRRYQESIVPENEGYEIIDRLFENAIEAYSAYYGCR